MTPISVEAPMTEDKVFNPAENLDANEAADPIINDSNPGEIEDENTLDNDQTSLIPEHTDTSKNNRLKNLGIGAMVAAGAVATAGAIFLSSFGGDKNKSPKPTNDNLPAGVTDITTSQESGTSVSSDGTEVAISSTTPTSETAQTSNTKETADASKENIDYTKTIYNIVEGYSFESLTSEQQSEIKKYEFMSKDEFQALPQGEQAVLGMWVLENYGPRFDVILKNSNIDDLHYTKNPKTAEEILGNYAYLMSMCCTLVELNADGNGAHENIELGQKVLGALRTTITEKHLDAANSWIEQTGGNIGVFDVDIKVIKSQNNSDGSIIINNIWNTTETVTVLPDSGFSQKTFIPFTVTNIRGESETIYLNSLAIGKDDPRYIDIG